ncbi:MAG: hypothetical protein BGO67_10315 [Alphaproteobacteria bacterium 41-28]|nr:MAG: hypothetical protein BGO67_10315 [Alphaproteobacteria bacterium 41-28]
MKKINLLMMLMTSSLLTFNAYAMDSEEENEEEPPYTVRLAGRIQLLGQGQAQGEFELTPKAGGTSITHRTPLLEVDVIEPFDSLFPPSLSAFDPLKPLPSPYNFGSSQKRIRCTFDYAGEVYFWEGLDTFTLPYQHSAKWKFPKNGVDKKNHTTKAKLVLKVQLEDNSIHTILSKERQIDHIPGAFIGSQQLEGYYYDGIDLFSRFSKSQNYTDPKSGQSYVDDYKSRDSNISSHKNARVIYIEPIPITGEKPVCDVNEYQGNYTRLGIGVIPQQDRKPYFDPSRLVYSNGAQLFPVMVTEELCDKNGWRVGFGIVSYRDSLPIDLNPNTLISEFVPLSEGLYYKEDVKSDLTHRVEHWVKLEPFVKPTKTLKIKVPNTEETFEPLFTLGKTTFKKSIKYLGALKEILLDCDVLNDLNFLPHLYAALTPYQGFKKLSTKVGKHVSIQCLDNLAQNLHVANPHLKLFGLVEVGINGTHEAQSFASCLSSLRDLQIIKLTGKVPQIHTVLTGAQPFKNLSYLNLSQSQLGDQGLAAIEKVVLNSHALTHLDLSGNGIGRNGAELIARFLSQDPVLTFLNLEDNQISNPIKTCLNYWAEYGRGLASLGRALQRNTHLNTINLSNNGEFDGPGTSAFLNTINITTLRTIYLDKNGEGAGASYLFNTLFPRLKEMFHKEKATQNISPFFLSAKDQIQPKSAYAEWFIAQIKGGVKNRITELQALNPLFQFQGSIFLKSQDIWIIF